MMDDINNIHEARDLLEQEMDLHLVAAMNSTNQAADILCIGEAVTAILEKDSIRERETNGNMTLKKVETLEAFTVSDYLRLANMGETYEETMRELEVTSLVDFYFKMEEWKERVSKQDALTLIDAVAQVCHDPDAHVDRAREMNESNAIKPAMAWEQALAQLTRNK